MTYDILHITYTYTHTFTYTYYILHITYYIYIYTYIYILHMTYYILHNTYYILHITYYIYIYILYSRYELYVYYCLFVDTNNVAGESVCLFAPSRHSHRSHLAEWPWAIRGAKQDELLGLSAGWLRKTIGKPSGNHGENNPWLQGIQLGSPVLNFLEFVAAGYPSLREFDGSMAISGT